MGKRRKKKKNKLDLEQDKVEIFKEGDPRMEPDWTKKCENCDQTPIVPLTGMCGPCTWGEAETMGGNW